MPRPGFDPGPLQPAGRQPDRPSSYRGSESVLAHLATETSSTVTTGNNWQYKPDSMSWMDDSKRQSWKHPQQLLHNAPETCMHPHPNEHSSYLWTNNTIIHTLWDVVHVGSSKNKKRVTPGNTIQEMQYLPRDKTLFCPSVQLQKTISTAKCTQNAITA